MNAAARDSLVTGHEFLIEGLVLPDVDDRHVLAPAVRSGAQVIVTFNLKDFPVAALKPLGVEAQSPDEFVLGLLDLAPGAAIVSTQAADLKKHPRRATNSWRRSSPTIWCAQ